MEKLTIEVTEKTADALRKAAGEAHLSIGEVVAHYALKAAPNDPENAVLLILEYYLISVSMLSKVDSAKVFGKICGIFLGSIQPEEFDEIVASIKSTHNWEHPAISPHAAEEQAVFRKSVDEMVQAAKDEYVRNVFYSLFHK